MQLCLPAVQREQHSSAPPRQDHPGGTVGGWAPDMWPPTGADPSKWKEEVRTPPAKPPGVPEISMAAPHAAPEPGAL